MTSPINFGGGVGTQPVIQNPSIGEQLAPLLEQLQFAQQQRLQQEQLAAAQANAERDDQLAALTQLTQIANDPALLNSETGVQLAELAGVPEQDLADMAAFAEQAQKDELAVLENVALQQFPDDPDKQAEMLVMLKFGAAGNAETARELMKRSGLLTPTEQEDAALRLTKLQGDKIRSDLDKAIADVKVEADKDEANQTIANILKVGPPTQSEDGTVTYRPIPGVDYVKLIQDDFANRLKPSGAMAARFASDIMAWQTFSRLNIYSPAQALEIGIQMEQSTHPDRPMSAELVPELQEQVNAADMAGKQMKRINEELAKSGRGRRQIVVPIEVEDDNGNVTVVDTPFDIERGDGKISDTVVEILEMQFPLIPRKEIKAIVQRAFDAQTTFAR